VQGKSKTESKARKNLAAIPDRKRRHPDKLRWGRRKQREKAALHKGKARANLACKRFA